MSGRASGPWTGHGTSPRGAAPKRQGGVGLRRGVAGVHDDDSHAMFGQGHVLVCIRRAAPRRPSGRGDVVRCGVGAPSPRWRTPTGRRHACHGTGAHTASALGATAAAGARHSSRPRPPASKNRVAVPQWRIPSLNGRARASAPGGQLAQSLHGCGVGAVTHSARERWAVRRVLRRAPRPTPIALCCTRRPPPSSRARGHPSDAPATPQRRAAVRKLPIDARVARPAP